MDQHEMGRGEAGQGSSGTSGGAGSANTPSFGAQGAAGGDEPMHGIAAAGTPPAQGGTRAGSRQGMGGPSGDAQERERAGEMRDQLEDRADDMLSRAAEGLDTAADRLDDFAERQRGQSGARNRVGRMAQGTADTLESTARYLRDNDVEGLQHDLERQVRNNPLQMLLIAIAAGWVVGKILR